MKYFHLIWAALARSKTRTLLTLMSVVAAFLLFGMQTARWTDTRAYTPCTRLQNPSCPGEVRIPNEQLLAPTIFAFVPFVGGRAEF